jgi:hypothetical protein
LQRALPAAVAFGQRRRVWPRAKKDPTLDGRVLRLVIVAPSGRRRTHKKFGVFLKISGSASGGLVFANRASPRYAIEI